MKAACSIVKSIASRPTPLSKLTRSLASSMVRMASTTATENTASPGLLEEYKQWKAMGQGGTSHSWAGFMSCKAAEKTMAFEDTLTPRLYRNPKRYARGWKQATDAQKAAAQMSFLKTSLPLRPEPRARAKKFVYPQRERDAAEPQNPEVKAAYMAAFQSLGDMNIDTEWKTSALEKHGTALFTKRSVSLSPLNDPTQREICHIHGTDLSGHVTLSFPDAEEVIAKGWGERHRLSGTDWIHLGYTMVYVPNTVEEVEILKDVFQAGIDFMKSG